MKKIFIYYSLTNNGDKVAEYLKTNGYDIRKVITSEPLPNNYILRILSGGYKAMINYQDNLVNFNNNIDEYDEVIIGTPIWNDRLSSPINSVLKQLKFKYQKVDFILYSGSGKTKKAIQLLNEEYPKSTIIELREPKENKDELLKLKLDNKQGE